MRLNQYIALHTGLSRRHADKLIKDGKVVVNNQPASLGQIVSSQDKVEVSGLEVQPQTKTTTIMLNKPAGYVCSRAGQGSKTVYDLLPPEFHHLKPVGRIDKDSSGLLLLTNDGQLANELTHPSYQKEKVYEVEIDRPLKPEDKAKMEKGVQLEDGTSKFWVSEIANQNSRVSSCVFRVTLAEGRNRQIRRTLAAVGYSVIKLHRIKFGNYELGELKSGNYKKI